MEIRRDIVFLTGWASFRIDGDTEYNHLREFIAQTVHKDAHWAVEEFADIDDGDTIADAIRRGIAVGVSDGSFKDSFGTSCWIIQEETQVGEIKCPCVVPGQGSAQSAYRSELAGMYGMITMINALCAFHNISEGDGLQALRHVDQRGDITNPRMAQFDLLSATRNSLRLCPIKVIMRHEKGHQDDDLDAVLDRWAALNVEVDDGAKEHWYRTMAAGHRQHRIFAETFVTDDRRN